MRRIFVASLIFLGLFLGSTLPSRAQEPEPVVTLTLEPGPVELTEVPLPTAEIAVTLDSPGLAVDIAPPIVSAIKPGEEVKGISLFQLANVDIDQVWRSILLKEYQYREMTGGSYFQGLRTHSKIPENGVAAMPDNWFVTPEDLFYRWQDIKIMAVGELPWALQIDVYDGPTGKGFIAKFLIGLNGIIYARDLNEGPEVWREQPWHAEEQ